MFQARFLARSPTIATPAPLGALILFDLDGFKAINDRYGHAAGDACLREVAVRLTSGFPGALMVARIGGDEFAALVPPSGATLHERIRAAIAQIGQPMFWRGQVLLVGASAGAAVPQDGWAYEAEELFGVADAALYGAKRQGRNRVIVAGGAKIDLPEESLILRRALR
jgi:diguanylate cyclase (GGDEF)-like protein